jgi:hypothetical protein
VGFYFFRYNKNSNYVYITTDMDEIVLKQLCEEYDDRTLAIILELTEIVGLPLDEALAVALNWSREQPQTMEEVRQGVIDERKRRDPNYEYHGTDITQDIEQISIGKEIRG